MIFGTNLFSMVLHRKVLSFFILKTFVEHCNLRNNHSVFTVNFSFLHSWWKNSLGQWDFGNQSWIKWHFYKFIWCIFGITKYQNISKKYSVFITLCEKKNSAYLNHNVRKASSVKCFFNGDLFLSGDIYSVSFSK